MKPRDYCCCAIPVVNIGIYATLFEQLVLAVVVGTLSVATPSIVGAATPSFAPWVLAIICYVAAAIQVLGLIGVAKEKSTLFRRYVTIHILITIAVFAVAAVWIAISASRHSTAQSNCESKFFGNGGSTTSEGETMCNIFPWVDIGIMGGLWVLFAISQLYFFVIISSYGSSQREDHEKYDSLNDPTNPLANDIPMTNRSDPWDSRPSTDNTGTMEYGHLRQASDASVLADKPLDHANVSHGEYDRSYPPYKKPSMRGGPSQPAYAYTQEPNPTPQFNDNYYSNVGTLEVNQPATIQAHPGAHDTAEGSFKRKTPRLQKLNPDFDQRW